MNWEQLKGIIERIATVAVAWAVGRGYVPEAISADIIAIILLAASITWGMYVNTQKSLIDATATMPDVDKIKVDNQIVANASPSAKVTTRD